MNWRIQPLHILMNFTHFKQYIIAKLQTELAENLYYHGIHHTFDVYESACNLAKRENITGNELVLLKTAVLLHDIGFTKQHAEHERIGCDIARDLLPNFNYKPQQIQRICDMIMATKIPQTPTNKLEQIICDADLDYLGRNDFYSIGNTLYKELTNFNYIQSEEQWNKIQLSFLEKHAYFTSTSKRLRSSKKAKHLLEIKAIVQAYH